MMECSLSAHNILCEALGGVAHYQSPTNATNVSHKTVRALKQGR